MSRHQTGTLLGTVSTIDQHICKAYKQTVAGHTDTDALEGLSY